MMNEKVIKGLEDRGFNRWTKGKYDRLYINARDLGLVCTYHKSGTEDVSEFRGHSISNSEARRMKYAKCYIDVETEEVVCDNDWMKEAAEEILAEVNTEDEKEESTPEEEAGPIIDAIVEASEKVEEMAKNSKAPKEMLDSVMHMYGYVLDYANRAPKADVKRVFKDYADYAKNPKEVLNAVKRATLFVLPCGMENAEMFRDLATSIKMSVNRKG